MTDLSNRLALVTGASRGIGAAVAKAYAKAGAHVILSARTVGALEAVDDEIRAAGGQATIMPVDLLDMDKVDAMGAAIHERFGKLDIFVGNAGMLGTLGPLAQMKKEAWDKTMALNVTTNFRLIRTLHPLLLASDAGRVIFTGSMTYNRPKAYWGPYRVSKAAVNMLALTYAAETEKTDMRVNVIHPGAVETTMLAKAYPGGYPDDDAQTPDDLIPAFLDLADTACTRHGEVINLYEE